VLGGLAENLVVDVGDVADEQHVVSADAEPAAQHVEDDPAAEVFDVRHPLRRRTAQVDGSLTKPAAA